MIHPAAAKVMEGDGSVRSKYGFSVKKASDGKCEIEMNVLSDWINAAGSTHGSVAYAIMDSACAYASASLNKLAVTINGNVNYMKGTKVGDRLLAVAELQTQSAKLMTFAGRVIDQDEKTIATGSFLFQVLGDRD